MVYFMPQTIYFKIQRVLLHMGKTNHAYAMCLLMRHNSQLEREGTFVEMPENILEEIKWMMFLAELNMNLTEYNAAKDAVKTYVCQRRMWQKRLQ